jgi:hypothetical protein
MSLLLYTWERTLLLSEYEARWAPEHVWNFWRREKYPSLPRI